MPAGFYYRQVTDTAVGDSSQSILICEFMTISPIMHMSMPATLINSTHVTYISSSDCLDPFNVPVWEQTFAGVVVDPPSVSVCMCLCMHVYICMCTCVCLCMCVCVYMHVCVRACDPNHSIV